MRGQKRWIRRKERENEIKKFYFHFDLFEILDGNSFIPPLHHFVHVLLINQVVHYNLQKGEKKTTKNLYNNYCDLFHLYRVLQLLITPHESPSY